MNELRKLFFTTLFVIASITSSSAQHTSGNDGFVIVELFTSEGCSSCPAAEKVCSKLHNEFKNVCFLEFHVDYWNYLGWKDQYSDIAYTKRQQDYARSFKLNSSYTPQAIVNGKKQMVGSDNDKLRSAIQTAMSNRNIVKLEVNATITGKTINVSYTTNSLNSVLNVAVVQVNAETNVKRGENAGKKLVHSSVVRNFKTVSDITKDGTIMIDLPPAVSKENFHVICFLQNKENNEIIAGAETSIK